MTCTHTPTHTHTPHTPHTPTHHTHTHITHTHTPHTPNTLTAANSSEENVQDSLRAVYTVTANPPAFIVTHTPPAPGLPLVAGDGMDGITTCYSKKKNKSWIKRQRCRECIGCLQKYHCGNCTGCK